MYLSPSAFEFLVEEPTDREYRELLVALGYDPDQPEDEEGGEA
jgi:hypothetical protein